jgi:F-box/leucine-rich repeat protein 14
MTRLRTLSLSACDISDEGLVRAAGALGHLETLHLGQCGKITDASLRALSEKCQGIEYIDLYGCGKISRTGLNTVMNMPAMKSMNLGLWHLR